VKTALMITYYFPPLGGIGVQRSAKFVKYLPHQGWNPVVLTVRDNWRNRMEQGVDHSLDADIPEQVEVIRSQSREYAAIHQLLFRLGLRKALIGLEHLVPFLPHYYKIGWYPFAIRAGRLKLNSAPVDVIYSSSTPYVAHFIGRALSREYGIPWVADFRDPWTQRTYGRPRALFQAKLDRRLERIVLESADAIVANTPTNKQAICGEFHVSADKVHVIPNGYDPEDFDHFEDSVPQEERFVISCVGTFYEMPDTGAFFRAYRRFYDDHPDAYLRFLGPRLRGVRDAFDRVLTPGSWEARQRIEHSEAVRIMQRSAVLLANLPLVTDVHWIPGKLYEYLAARRPILFIGPTLGDAATILQRAGTGLIVANEETAILTALRSLYADWQAGHQLDPDLEVVHEYDRRRQTQVLAEVFEQVLQTYRQPLSMDHHRLRVG
jgi:glycosyltransferase involved in cell wall biosynthesis